MLHRVTPALNGDIPIGDGAVMTCGRGAAAAALQLAAGHPRLAVDTETAGLGVLARAIKTVTIGIPDHAVVLDPRDPQQAAAIREALARAEELVFHGAAFDVPALTGAGLMSPEAVWKVLDTLVTARLAEPGDRVSKRLADVADRYLGTGSRDLRADTFRRLGLTKTQGYRVIDLDRPAFTVGAALDVILTARLLEPVTAAARRQLLDHPFGPFGLSDPADVDHILQREQIVNRVMLARSVKGLLVDLEELERYRGSQVDAQREWTRVLLAAGVSETNPNSLIDLLEGEAALPEGYPRTSTGRPSTKREDLLRLDHDVAEAFTRLRESVKTDRDYLSKTVDLADDHARIHPQVGVLAAVSGRMSMSDPPLQQFPGAARGIILADPGDSLTSIDWSQIEPVVLANMARDEKVLAGYESGESDLYSDVAAFAKVDRKAAKVTLLATLYGEGRATLALDLGVTVPRAAAIQRRVMGTLPRSAKLVAKVRGWAEEHRMVPTLSGRILPIPASADGTRVAVHKGINYLVQGGSADVLHEAILAIHDAGLADAVYLAMHDELVVSSDAAEDVRTIMETPPERLCMFAGRTPILRTDMAHLGDRWAEA